MSRIVAEPEAAARMVGNPAAGEVDVRESPGGCRRRLFRAQGFRGMNPLDRSFHFADIRAAECGKRIPGLRSPPDKMSSGRDGGIGRGAGLRTGYENP